MFPMWKSVKSLAKENIYGTSKTETLKMLIAILPNRWEELPQPMCRYNRLREVEHILKIGERLVPNQS